MRLSIRLTALAGACCLLGAASLTNAEPATAQAIPVAVFDFGCATSDTGQDIAQTLAAHLSSQSGIKLVDRMSLGAVLAEQELSMSGLIGSADGMRTGHLIGAKLLVGGRLFCIGHSLYFSSKIVGTETGLVDSVVVEGPVGGDVKKLIDDLATKVADEIRTRGTDLIAVDATDPLLPLRAKLTALSHIPRVSISIHEEHFDQPEVSRETPSGDSVQSEMRDTLMEAGVPVTTGAEIVVNGKGFSESATYVGEMVTVSAWAEITATDSKTNAVIFSGREIARATDLSVNVAAELAREKVGRALAIRLVERLTTVR